MLTNTEQTEKTKQTNGLSEWSTDIVNNFSLMVKTKNQSKKAINAFSNYIKINNIELSDDVNHELNFLLELWNSEDKFELSNLIEVIDLHTNNLSENDFINLEDKYVLKLWKVYSIFTDKLIKSGKNVVNFYENNKDKISLMKNLINKSS
jgi:hypothetical protein